MLNPAGLESRRQGEAYAAQPVRTKAFKKKYPSRQITKQIAIDLNPASVFPSFDNMQGVPEQFEFPEDRAEFRVIAGHRGVELYRARIVRHAFEPHTHMAFGFGTIERGVERFRYKGNDHIAPEKSIVLMNPDVLHTGRSETASGWQYRMIYLHPDALAEISEEPGWWFAEPVMEDDRARAMRLSALLEAIWRIDDPLTFDGLLFRIVSELRPYARVARRPTEAKLHRFESVLDYMHAHLDRRIVLGDLAAVAGLSPFHFLRQFQARHHVTPHQMLMALRLHAAKEMLAAGQRPADIAAAVGLTDQAHLNRAFRCRYGVTPARYRQQVRV